MRNRLKESPGFHLHSFLVLDRKQLWRSKKKCERGEERNVKKKRESASGKWSERENGKGRENGSENETERESAGGKTNDLTIDYFCV